MNTMANRTSMTMSADVTPQCPRAAINADTGRAGRSDAERRALSS